jgi:hypothetical protein
MCETAHVRPPRRRSAPYTEPVYVLYQCQFSSTANASVAPMHRSGGPSGRGGAAAAAGPARGGAAGPRAQERAWGGSEAWQPPQQQQPMDPEAARDAELLAWAEDLRRTTASRGRAGGGSSGGRRGRTAVTGNLDGDVGGWGGEGGEGGPGSGVWRTVNGRKVWPPRWVHASSAPRLPLRHAAHPTAQP